MTPEIFKTALVVGYKDFFGKEFSGDRMKLLKGIPKRHLIHEIAGLNHRLKPAIDKSFDSSFETQLTELRYFCASSFPEFRKYAPTLKKIDDAMAEREGSGKAVMFHRPANVFALSEIIENIPDTDFEFKWEQKYWNNLLLYYLCVNDVVTAYDRDAHDSKYSDFEKLAAGSGFINELIVVNDPFLPFQRFIELIKYIQKDPLLGEPLIRHFTTIGISVDKFASIIMSICFFHKGDKEFVKYCHKLLPDDKEAILFFDWLSRRGLVPKAHELDVAEIKKSPIFKDIDYFYVILDNIMLLEKLYEFFINDFWFETVKPLGIHIREYRGRFGYFFENHVGNQFKIGLRHLKSPIKLLDELKRTVGKSEIELADMYAQEGKKVLLGQFKSTGIYSDQLYGTAQSLFKEKEDYFYEVFGLNQLIKSIEHLVDTPKEYDDALTSADGLEVYPVIVVNEKILQTAFFPAMLQLRFQQLTSVENFKSLKINPLTVMHVSEVETLCYNTSIGKANIWELLEENSKGSLFPKPFFITLNRRKLNPNYKAAQEQIAEFCKLSR